MAFLGGWVVAFFIIMLIIGLATGAGKKTDTMATVAQDAAIVETMPEPPKVETRAATTHTEPPKTTAPAPPPQPSSPPPSPPMITPQDNVIASAKNVLKDDFRAATVTGGEAIITFKLSNYQYADNADQRRQWADSTIVNTAHQIYIDEGSVSMITFVAIGDVTDVYGNTTEKEALRVKLSKESNAKIGPDMKIANFPMIADYYDERVNF